MQPALGQQPLERAVRLVGLGDHEQPGGVAVETMHDPRAPRLAAIGADVRESLRERPGAVAASRVHDDAGRLVDDQQVLVLVGDRERRGRSFRGRRGVRGLDLDPLAGAHRVALRPRPPVDQHAARVDQALGAGAGAERLSEERVQARPGRVLRDLELDPHDVTRVAGGPRARTRARSPRT